jgi:hypothetical protein
VPSVILRWSTAEKADCSNREKKPNHVTTEWEIWKNQVEQGSNFKETAFAFVGLAPTAHISKHILALLIHVHIFFGRCGQGESASCEAEGSCSIHPNHDCFDHWFVDRFCRYPVNDKVATGSALAFSLFDEKLDRLK